MPTKCNDDSCDAAHCPSCGGHKMDWYAPGLCSKCELENDLEWEKECQQMERAAKHIKKTLDK